MYPYLLYVRNNDGYKNFTGFIGAYAALACLKLEFDIVCFGGGLFSTAQLTPATELGL